MGRRTRKRRIRSRPQMEFDPETQLYDGIDLFLTHWPEFQYAMYLSRVTTISQLKSEIMDYFHKTNEPNLNDLTRTLNDFMPSNLLTCVDFHTCEMTAGQLLNNYHASSSSECIEISNTIDLVLVHWSQFQEVLDIEHKDKKSNLKTAIISLFFENPETNVEDLAKTIHDFVLNLIDPLFDFADCKKAAIPMWKIHQGCLDEDFTFIRLLTKQINELIEGTDEPL